MKSIHTFQVFPNLPRPLAFLGELSRNLWWSWHQDAIELFRRIDPRRWEQTGTNPISLLATVPQDRLTRLSADDSFLSHMEQVRQVFDTQVGMTVNHEGKPYGHDRRIAYFSMEFGIHETLPLFAGGLGILAGDHLKSASHLGLPVTGVGLLYRQGYFRQYLDPNGWQQEAYPETDLYTIPMARVRGADNRDLRVQVDGRLGESIIADVWTTQVGRVPLLLLDTNLPENPPHVRDITSRLYAGDPDIRLAQEVLLGIGGMRALTAMGIEPVACHMNEGHCTFANIERLAQIMETHGVDLPTAMEIVPRSTIFTTHTPVAAGHDEFTPDQVRPYLTPLAKRLGITPEALIAWGQTEGNGPDSPFSMFILGLHLSQYCNGVSRLHGQVARKMWSHVWPARADYDIPIDHVTNGVHIATILSPDLIKLFERYLGPDWNTSSQNPEIVERVDEVFDEELWRAHELSRARLISTVRDLLVRQHRRRNAPTAVIRAAESVLDPEVLTIGFARRFATYKRANLIFRNKKRLLALLTDSERPIQIIFAGKAHPKDNEGKGLIQSIVQFSNQPEMQHRVVFLEDYDMQIARALVQGVDVWLNNPRRPLEACGTSGMKAAANGVLNASILDGWWAEGYHPDRGWRIGNGEEYSDAEYQDAVESQAIYNVLENHVIPCFYNRSSGNMPADWIAKMKASIKMAMTDYCSHRMVAEYDNRFYIPAARSALSLYADQADQARKLSVLHQRLREYWADIRIEAPTRERSGPFHVTDTFTVTARVHLGELGPEDVDVELFYGRVRRIDELIDGHTMAMAMVTRTEDGTYIYQCQLQCNESGRYGLTARVVPRADDWIRYTPGLLTWAE